MPAASCGIELRPAQPAALQLQQPAGDVPGLRRPGRPPRLRPRLARPRPVALGLGRGDRALGPVKRDGQVATAHLRRGRGQPRGRPATARPKGTMLKGPWRDLDAASGKRAWLYGTRRPADRLPLEDARARSGRTPRSGKASPPSCWPSSRGLRRADPAQLEPTCGA